jgi:endonuclease/exonuclease/phosphatase (EEP) superfamily protein YafD
MSTTKRIIFYITLFIGTLLIVVTLLSLVYDIKLWYLKALDFPRVQVLIALTAILILFAVINKSWKTSAILFIVGLITSIILQITFVFPYTPLASKTVADVSGDNEQRTFSLMLANVLMKNDKADAFLEIVKEADPDILLAMETNKWWIEQLGPLREKYPHQVEYPLDNTYGIALYSKYPLDNTQIKFLSKEKVPSIHTLVKLTGGQTFMLYAIHPVPPKPSKHPDNVGEKEVALEKIGKLVAQREGPTMVAGDFNDVAWSNTSRLFDNNSRLSDVRIGRGMYHSFDATSMFMRWPLDHVYVSEEFRVQELKRLPKYGSDHFPVLIRLAIQ